MANFLPFAHPFWVNFLICIPFVLYFYPKGKLDTKWKDLLLSGLWALGFGIVEAAVVVYVRGIMNLLAGGGASLRDISIFSEALFKNEAILASLSSDLYRLELIREAATILMLVSVSFLISRGYRERIVGFLWTFAVWDLVFYITLKLAINWPQSIFDFDILFLLPVPWLAQVWFPILTSGLTILAVVLRLSKKEGKGRLISRN